MMGQWNHGILQSDEPEVLQIEMKVWRDVLTRILVSGVRTLPQDVRTRIKRLLGGALLPRAVQSAAPRDASTVVAARTELTDLLESMGTARDTVEQVFFARFSVRWLAWLASETEGLSDGADNSETQLLKTELQVISTELKDVLTTMRRQSEDDSAHPDERGSDSR